MTHSDLAESVFTKLSENVEYIHESIETMEIGNYEEYLLFSNFYFRS